jgi:AraC-like DNA-binding protein
MIATIDNSVYDQSVPHSVRSLAKIPKIAARPVIFIVNELRRHGVAVDDLLKEVGLRRTSLADPEARVSYSGVLDLIERAATATRDASFGLRLGASRDQHDSGLIGFVLLNSPALMDALANLQRYFRVVGDGEDFEIERGGPHVELRFRVADPKMRGLRHNSDYIAAMLVRACRDMTRKRVSPVRVEFTHRRPDQQVGYAEILGCPVKFNAEWDSLIYSTETMRLPVIGADDRLLKVLEDACNRILGPTPKKQDLIRDVRELIIDRLARGTADLDGVARELNISSKTLERRLAEKGVGFSKLLEDIRCHLAKQYLADTAFRLDQISYLVGYSQSAAFVRAFRRWTETTPIQYRERRRQRSISRSARALETISRRRRR